MSYLADYYSVASRALLGNRETVPYVLAINAAAAATVKTTTAINYTINGAPFTKAILAAQVLAAPLLVPFYVQPVSTTVYFILTVNAAGVVQTYQSNFAGRRFLLNGMPVKGDGSYADGIPGTEYVFGVIKVITNGATTFTPATTALDAAGLTVTFTDLFGAVPVALL